ncbi:hypothetical protein [Extibacter sp. GGCC_0201]|uniref:hypothetical protein n=1 Tax=Extibacter sp. GGCC_0201 TaxID=2731209 RepID=UPI002ED50455
MIEYRKLTTKELETFIDMRINQLREEGATKDIECKNFDYPEKPLKYKHIRRISD